MRTVETGQQYASAATTPLSFIYFFFFNGKESVTGSSAAEKDCKDYKIKEPVGVLSFIKCI